MSRRSIRRGAVMAFSLMGILALSGTIAALVIGSSKGLTSEETRTYTAAFYDIDSMEDKSYSLIHKDTYKKGETIKYAYSDYPTRFIDKKTDKAYTFIGWDLTGDRLPDVCPWAAYSNFEAYACYSELDLSKYINEDLIQNLIENVDIEKLLDLADFFNIDLMELLELLQHLFPDLDLSMLADITLFTYEVSGSSNSISLPYFRLESYGDWSVRDYDWGGAPNCDTSSYSVDPLGLASDKLKTLNPASTYAISYPRSKKKYVTPVYPDAASSFSGDVSANIAPSQDSEGNYDYSLDGTFFYTSEVYIDQLRKTNYSTSAYDATEASYRDYVYSHYLSYDDKYRSTFQKIQSENEIPSYQRNGDYKVIDDVVSYFASDDVFRWDWTYINYNISSMGGTEFHSYPSSEDPILYLLDGEKNPEHKGGACHIANAVTEFFRSVGVPARFVKGYFDSAFIQSGNLSATSGEIKLLGNEHYWVEVYIDKVGWMNVDIVLSQLLGTSDMDTSVDTSGSQSNSSVYFTYTSNYKGLSYFKCLSLDTYHEDKHYWSISPAELSTSTVFSSFSPNPNNYAYNAMSDIGVANQKLGGSYSYNLTYQKNFTFTDVFGENDGEGVDAALVELANSNFAFAPAPIYTNSSNPSDYFYSASSGQITKNQPYFYSCVNIANTSHDALSAFRFNQLGNHLNSTASLANYALYQQFASSSYEQIPDAYANEVEAILNELGISNEDAEVINEVRSALRDDGFLYTQDYQYDEGDVVLNFLDQKKGNDTLFSTLTVFLYRALGYPSRYVTGFVSSSSGDSSETISVGASGLRTWVEVFVPEVGWINVDPLASSSSVSDKAKVDGVEDVSVINGYNVDLTQQESEEGLTTYSDQYVNKRNITILLTGDYLSVSADSSTFADKPYLNVTGSSGDGAMMLQMTPYQGQASANLYPLADGDSLSFQIYDSSGSWVDYGGTLVDSIPASYSQYQRAYRIVINNVSESTYDNYVFVDASGQKLCEIPTKTSKGYFVLRATFS